MHIEDAELEAYVSEKASPNRASAIESHLVSCADCGRRMIEIVRRLGGSIKVAGGDFGKYRGDERRSEPRIPASGTAHMQLLSPFDPTRIDVEIVDRSPSGLKIRTPREILRGTLIQLRLDHGLVLGEIRYCNAEDGRFVVGIQIQDQMGT